MKKVVEKNNTCLNYILLFFTFAFLGWIYEVLLHLIEHHVFMNKGVLFGPWLPIYGYGAIIMLLLTKKYQDNPKKIFIICFLVAGIIEYLSSLYLDYVLHYKWWDYSNYLLNINGRVSIIILLLFAVVGTLAIYYLVPKLLNLYNKINNKIKILICIILLSCYLVDRIHSIKYPNMGSTLIINTQK